MSRKFLLVLMTAGLTQALTQAGTIQTSSRITSGFALKAMTGCSDFFCAMVDGASGVYSLGSHDVRTSFEGGNSISTALPNQFASLVRTGSLSSGSTGTPIAARAINATPDVSGYRQPGDSSASSDPVYYLVNGHVSQRDLPNLLVDHSDLTNQLLANLSAGSSTFNVYATSIAASSNGSSNSGSLASLVSDPGTGGATSSGGGGAVLPTVGSSPSVAPSDNSGSSNSSPGSNDSNPSSGLMSGDHPAGGVSDVPEPSTELLIGIGVVAIGTASRFTRRPKK